MRGVEVTTIITAADERLPATAGTSAADWRARLAVEEVCAAEIVSGTTIGMNWANLRPTPLMIAVNDQIWLRHWLLPPVGTGLAHELGTTSMMLHVTGSRTVVDLLRDDKLGGLYITPYSWLITSELRVKLGGAGVRAGIEPPLLLVPP